MVGLELPLRSYARHMNVTEAAPPLFNHLVQHAGHLLSMKQANAGNIVIGGGWPAGHGSSSRLGAVLRRSIAGNMGVAVTVAPGVSGLGLLRTWTGVIFLVPDGNAIIGQSARVPGFFHAVPPNAGYTGGPPVRPNRRRADDRSRRGAPLRLPGGRSLRGRGRVKEAPAGNPAGA